MIIKEWALSWFKFVMNLDIKSIIKFYPEVVISIMNFYSEISNEQFIFKIDTVLERALEVYCEHKPLQNSWMHLSFLHRILLNTEMNIKPMVITIKTNVFIKAMEKSLQYILAILDFLQNDSQFRNFK